MMLAVKKHTQEKWILLYIERWLTAPVLMPDGSLVERVLGTPQGGVVTPQTQKVTSNFSGLYNIWAWLSGNLAGTKVRMLLS